MCYIKFFSNADVQNVAIYISMYKHGFGKYMYMQY